MASTILNHVVIILPFVLLFLSHHDNIAVQGFTTSTSGNHFAHRTATATTAKTTTIKTTSLSTKLYSKFPKQSGSHLPEIDIDALVDEVASDAVIAELSRVDGESSSISSTDDEEEEELDEQTVRDGLMMKKAVELAQSRGGQKGSEAPFPKPIVGAVIVTKDGQTLGSGRSDYRQHAIQAAIADAGIDATPLSEWCVTWPRDSTLRENLRESTLYVTLEPSAERGGANLPPLTQLIQLSGIPRVVIGCPDAIPELASEGAATLHSAGLIVNMGILQTECESLIEDYSTMTNSKLQKMARKHFQTFNRPLGFLHCSVVEADDVDSFTRNGNSFGKNFGGKELSSRDFGSYKLAPPPESIWADDASSDDFDTDEDDYFTDFEAEEEQESLGSNPMMPWYEQVDAVVATFPKPGNGKEEDDTVAGRLYGLKWLATSGSSLPANVERILVMDATDLPDLPTNNDDENLPPGVDVEAFWRANGGDRKPTRILLRHGDNAQAISAANAAAQAAAAASNAAQRAKEAIETGEAELAAEAALECQQAAMAATVALQREMQVM